MFRVDTVKVNKKPKKTLIVCAVEVTAVTVATLSPDTRSAWCNHMLISPNLGTCVNIRKPKFSDLPSFNFTDCVVLFVCVFVLLRVATAVIFHSFLAEFQHELFLS